MSLFQVVQILLARLWVIVITLVVGVTIAVITVLALPERFTASSSVILEVGDRDPITGLVQNTARTYIRTQLKLAQSARVAAKVVERLNLNQSQYFLTRYNAANPEGINAKTWIGKELQKNLSAAVSGGSEIITISYTANSPALAARVANAFAVAYTEVDLELRVDPAKRNAQWFAAQLNKLRMNLEEAQSELNDFQRKVGIVSITSEEMAEGQKISEIESKATEARTLASEARSLINQYEAFVNSGSNIDSLPAILETGDIAKLRQELSRIDAISAELSGKIGENHPQYKAIVARRSVLSQQLSDLIAQLGTTIKDRVSIAEAKANSLQNELVREKSRLLEEKSNKDRLDSLVREVQIKKAQYDNAYTRASTLSMEGDLAQTGVAIVEEATPPSEASFPRKRLAVSVAAVACFLLGVGLAFLLEMIDRRIRSEMDLEQITETEVLATIPSLKKIRAKNKKQLKKMKKAHKETSQQQTSRMAAE